jgi:hypothetical protein
MISSSLFDNSGAARFLFVPLHRKNPQGDALAIFY